jgi:hypothetical protein
MADIVTGREEVVSVTCHDCGETFQVRAGFLTTDSCLKCISVLADKFFALFK